MADSTPGMTPLLSRTTPPSGGSPAESPSPRKTKMGEKENGEKGNGEKGNGEKVLEMGDKEFGEEQNPEEMCREAPNLCTQFITLIALFMVAATLPVSLFFVIKVVQVSFSIMTLVP